MNWLFFRFNAGGRLAEWVASIAMFWLAIRLAVPGDTFTSSKGFSALAMVPGGEAMIAVPLGIVATIRILALLTNGRLPPATHHVRTYGAAVGFVFFMSMGVLLEAPFLLGVTGAVSTSPAMYFAVAFGELMSVWRASADARFSRKH